MLKKCCICACLILMVSFLPVRSHAGSPLQVVLYDSLIGAGIGALVGASTLAFMDNPSDNTIRIAQGASIGLICGLAFGLYEISPMFYTMRTPAGEKEWVYGLQVGIPFK
ncbi:MAG TPA: hypothetical protein ENN34_10045 [Deltaproteobacteria bacterium]|nr:hypothetical protein [Deltaproteobacteria bacterium]